ncbi:MAG: hypothetical protein MUO63_13060 [Desulfobulbaceae bacterium]|nr:hypothetical protein [Desulfobulbaceae bacterium]
MDKRSVKLIIASLVIHFSLCTANASSEVKQDTKGNQSPAVYISPGGSSKISYDISDKAIGEIDRVVSEIRQQFSNCLEVAIDYQNKKLKDLNQTLSELHAQETTNPKEAKKWAQDLIEKAPEIRNEKQVIDELKDKYNKEFSKNLLANVYKLFNYIFQTVDSRLLAFQELNTEVKYEKNENFILFNDESTQINRYVARTVILPNGNYIQIICITGKITQGIVSTCPILIFEEGAGEKTIQSFRLVPDYGAYKLTLMGPGVQLPQKERVLTNIEYGATGEEMLTVQLKGEFNSTFQEFFKLAYTR